MPVSELEGRQKPMGEGPAESVADADVDAAPIQPLLVDALPVEEFTEAWFALSAADLRRIRAYSVSLVRCLSGNIMDPDDLRQEVYALTLAGQRRCPRNVPIVAYIRQTMRSIVSTARRKFKDIEIVDIFSHDLQHNELRSNELTPEEQLHIQQVLAAIAGDQQVQQFIALVMQGFRGAELMDRLQLDEHGLAALRRKAKRRFAKQK